MEFYPADWNPPDPVDLDETHTKNGETQGIEQTRDEDQPSAAGHLNNSGELRPDLPLREESPILHMSPRPNQSIDEQPELAPVRQAVELLNDGREEIKEQD